MDKASSRRRTMRVTVAQDVATDVLRLVLVPVEEDTLPGWEAGAHIDLHLASGLIRQYSLCGDTADTTSYAICVLREVNGRGGSAEVHDTLRAGSAVVIQGPRNHFVLVPAQRYLFLAGGIGITPIKAMIDEAERQGAEWNLIYGGRTRDSMAFGTELAKRYPDRVQLVPQDVDGLIDVVRAVAGADASTHVYCCGPEGLLDAAGKACEAVGIADRLHIERFSAGDAPAAPATVRGNPDGRSRSDPAGRRPHRTPRRRLLLHRRVLRQLRKQSARGTPRPPRHADDPGGARRGQHDADLRRPVPITAPGTRSLSPGKRLQRPGDSQHPSVHAKKHGKGADRS
jgi:ferredoxin-NADP reductase